MSQHICPYCGAHNKEDSSTHKSVIDTYLPSLVMGAVTAGATVIDKRFGLATGGVTIAYAVATYLDGKKITCGNCNKHYSI